MKSTFPALASLSVLLPALAAAAEPTNLVRNPGFENAAQAWSLPQTFTVVDGVARSGTRSLRLVNTNPATYLLARQSVPFQAGRRYRYGAWIRTREVKGDDSGATICLEWSGAQGWIGGSYAEGKKGDRDWFHVEGPTCCWPTRIQSLRPPCASSCRRAPRSTYSVTARNGRWNIGTPTPSVC